MGAWWCLSVCYFVFCFFVNVVFAIRETGECFLEPCPDNKRDRATLESLILKRVRPGTRVLTDGWAGYKHLEKLGKSLFVSFNLTLSFLN